MLAPADAHLDRRDRDLPGLRLLLDDADFTRALRTVRPEAGITSARCQYVRYKPGVSCLAAYRVRATGGEVDVYARTHAAEMLAKVIKAAERSVVPGPLGFGIAVLPRLPMALFEFPNDHELPALGRLADDSARKRLFRRVLPERPEAWDARAVPVRYKPERRLVARLVGDGEPRAILKFYTERDSRRAARNARAFRAADGLRVADVIGRSRRHRVLAFAWIDGEPLTGWEPARSDGDDLALRIGSALASLHCQQPKLTASYGAAEYIRSLRQATATIEATCPRLGTRASQLAGCIEGALGRHQWTTCAIHGDFSTEQILVTGDGLAILDFDRAGYGEPAIDAGSFAARHLADVIGPGRPADLAHPLIDGLLEGYRRRSGRDLSGAVELFTAGGLLRLAVEPFRHRLEDWPVLTERHLDLVEELATDGRRFA